MPLTGSILIVDDNSTNLNVLVEYLSHAGFELSVARDGLSALELVELATPDLVLLDVMMPGLDGFETCRRIKAMPHGHNLPVIFMTALSETADKVRGFEAGAVDYVTKPLQYAEVQARIVTHLTLRNLQHSLREQNNALARQRTALAQLAQLSQELTASLNLQQIADHLARATTALIGAQSVSVWIPDSDGALACWMSSDHMREHAEQYPLNLRLQPGQGIAGWVTQHGMSVLLTDAHSDPRFFPGIDQQIGFHTASLLAVPLIGRGTPLGVLEVVNKLDGAFTADDLQLTETLAASAAIAIDNARLVEAMREHSTELEEQNAELDAFSHTVAHDLKTPLATLAGYSELIQRRTRMKLTDAELDQFLDKISINARKMSNIISELLLLANVRKTGTITIEPLDMQALAAEARSRLSALIAESAAVLHTPAEWPMALGHAAWVEEVWANYLSNALKYGGTPPEITFGATPTANGMVRFWVRDNGPGLTPEEQTRLFTAFTRLHQVKKVEGHGLGLSIVQRIIEKLDGQVGVESAPGQGSTFYFTLPAARA